MFQGDDIKQLVATLKTRSVRLYHACQYQDFISYVRLGGVPSRALLERRRESFTAFDTDGKDHTNGVWEKVFVNLEDFGRSFADGNRAVPNPYGPILLILRPEALLEAEDVAICLRSAGGRAFDRERESLTTIAEVERLFFAGSRLKWTEKLRLEFGNPEAHAPEVSCTVSSGMLSLRFLEKVLVDPYVFFGVPLSTSVKHVVAKHKIDVPVYRRDFGIRVPLYAELGAAVSEAVTLDDLLRGDAGEDLKRWAAGVVGKKLRYQFDRYASYLGEGTSDVLGTNVIDGLCDEAPEQFEATTADTPNVIQLDDELDPAEAIEWLHDDLLTDAECPECGALGSFEIRSSGAAVCRASGCSGVGSLSLCASCDLPLLGPFADERLCDECATGFARG